MELKLFWRMFEKTRCLNNGCIEWASSVDKRTNTPIILFDGQGLNAKRVLWKELFGPLKTNQIIRSRCGNNLCLHLDHF